MKTKMKIKEVIANEESGGVNEFFERRSKFKFLEYYWLENRQRVFLRQQASTIRIHITNVFFFFLLNKLTYN